MYLNLPPQCWHWSPTQPGKHTQLPAATLHWPFRHGLSHSFASVKSFRPESSTAADSRSAAVSVNKLRPRPEPEQAHRVAPHILRLKDGCWRPARAASGAEPTSCERAPPRPNHGAGSQEVTTVKELLAGYLGYIFQAARFPRTATSRILTSRSDVITTEMRTGSKGAAQNFKLLLLPECVRFVVYLTPTPPQLVFAV